MTLFGLTCSTDMGEQYHFFCSSGSKPSFAPILQEVVRRRERGAARDGGEFFDSSKQHSSMPAKCDTSAGCTPGLRELANVEMEGVRSVGNAISSKGFLRHAFRRVEGTIVACAIVGLPPRADIQAHCQQQVCISGDMRHGQRRMWRDTELYSDTGRDHCPWQQEHDWAEQEQVLAHTSEHCARE